MVDSLGRLRRRSEFLQVAAGRRKWVAPGFVLQALKRGMDPMMGATVVRVGFTASRKVGSAVARNRARRRLREAARQVLPAQARPGYDLVLVARRETLTRNFAALVADLEVALRRLGVARDDAGG